MEMRDTSDFWVVNYYSNSIARRMFAAFFRFSYGLLHGYVHIASYFYGVKYDSKGDESGLSFVFILFTKNKIYGNDGNTDYERC